jgi:DNA-binding MarR family transcriptional regulator
VDEVPWLNEAEQRAWLSYRRMRTLLDLYLARDLLTDSGLSEADYDVLSTLSERPGGQWRPNELAARLLWSTSRLAHHAGRMERRGLIARSSCPDDKRGAAIDLTQDGWEALRDAAPDHVRSVRRHLIDLLTPAEIDTLAVISSKVIDHFAAEQVAVDPPAALT